jgi:hypothetical protein
MAPINDRDLLILCVLTWVVSMAVGAFGGWWFAGALLSMWASNP